MLRLQIHRLDRRLLGLLADKTIGLQVDGLPSIATDRPINRMLITSLSLLTCGITLFDSPTDPGSTFWKVSLDARFLLLSPVIS